MAEIESTSNPIVQRDTILELILQIKGLLTEEYSLGSIQYLSNLLSDLNSQLGNIDDDSSLLDVLTRKSILVSLEATEINIIRQIIEKLAPNSSLITTILEILQKQLFIDMELHSDANDRYFEIAIEYLDSHPNIDYLNNQEQFNDNARFVFELFLKLISALASRALHNIATQSYSMFVSDSNENSFFDDTHRTLLNAVIPYIDNYFSSSTIEPNKSYFAIQYVIKLLQNLTDKSSLVPYFVEANYPQAILKWIASDDLDKHSYEIWLRLISLVSNTARNPLGAQALNRLNAISILNDFKSKYSSTITKKHEDILALYYMTYASLLDPEELKNHGDASMYTVINYIINKINEAFNSPKLRTSQCHVTEFLTALSKLAINDKCTQYILNSVKVNNENAFDFFMKKFIEYTTMIVEDKSIVDLWELVCSTLFNIFWSFSFQKDWQEKLSANEDFVKIVKEAAYQPSVIRLASMAKRLAVKIGLHNTSASVAEPVSNRISEIKNAAKGILSNLDTGLDLLTPEIPPDENDTEMSVMVSYSHSDATFCKRLVSSLKDKIDDVWVDYEKLESNDCWEDIANAITQAKLIIMIVTEHYCASKSCRREATHIDRRSKNIIPIYLSRYKPEEWLDIRIGNATYVRFNEDTYDESLGKLFELIFINERQLSIDPTKDRVSNFYPETEAVSDAPEPLTPNVQMKFRFPSVSPHFYQKSIHDWTSDDVKQWFLHEKLSPALCDLYSFSNGDALLAYTKLVLSDKSKLSQEYNTLSKRLNSDAFYLDHFAKFISAAENLMSQFDTRTIDTWSQDDIQRWFIEKNLPVYLCSMYRFSNGKELLMYAEMKHDQEYEKLKTRVEEKFGKTLYLDEYAKLMSALAELTENAKNEKIKTNVIFNNNNYVKDDTMFIKVTVDFADMPKMIAPYTFNLNLRLPHAIQEQMIEQEIKRRQRANSVMVSASVRNESTCSESLTSQEAVDAESYF
ncbi:unnamed protein product [Didymodactylos carnosus]|uniref:TIR domain-containing protein n=1 Tax=Didymodactylos carnosus TaxID=1234261 RepID=A0A814JZU2_9BILA|nr:unnamed protein product [Didymodactylos carnosus]CAF3815801.1 unnamed protein product [Didymodactylos carnosus]